MISYTLENLNSWSRLGMRKCFGVIMEELIDDYPSVCVLSADTASSGGLMNFSEKYKNNFYDVGIAEQNMVGIAAGLAKEGNNVFVVTFTPFLSLRALEAIRTLVGYMQLNVKIIALGSGVSLGVQGNTHFGLEDIAVMRTIPGIKILSPADCYEEAKCIEYLCKYNGPAYLRLTGIDGSGTVFKEKFDYNINEDYTVRDGEDVLVYSTGSVVGECVRASRALKKANISSKIIDIHNIKPLNEMMIRSMATTHKMIVSVEEHTVIGGMGSALAEILSSGDHSPLIRIGINDVFPQAGTYSYMLDQCGLSAVKIRDAIIENYNKTGGK